MSLCKLNGWFALLAAMMWIQGCSAGVNSKASGATGVPPETNAPASTAAAQGADAADDTDWLVTEDGRQYKLEKFEKLKYAYRWVDDKRARLAYGVEVEVEREDAEFLYYRIYRPDPNAQGPQREGAAAREERGKVVRAEMTVDLREVDTLQAVDFGRGLPAEGQWRNGFEFADMNEDGVLDLVHGPSRKGQARPQIFLGDGQGGWKRWAAASYPSARYDYGDISVGDFDGDGHRDLVLGVHLRGLLVLLGDGKGGFRIAGEGLPWRTDAPGEAPGFSSRQVQVVDWDGDGRDDFLALGEGPRLNITAGSSGLASGSYGVRLYLSQRNPSGGLNWSWANPHDELGNFFGDDLRLVAGAKERSFVVGTSKMNETSVLFEDREEEKGWLRTALPIPPRSYAFGAAPFRDSETEGVAVAGITFDGGLKMRMIEVYRRDGEEWKRQTVWSEEKGNRGPVRVVAADLNGDRRADLVGLGAEGQVWVLLQERSGWRLEISPEVQGPEGCAGYGLEARDLDGDGRAEIAMSFAGEQSAMFAPLACPTNGALKVWKFQPRSK